MLPTDAGPPRSNTTPLPLLPVRNCSSETLLDTPGQEHICANPLNLRSVKRICQFFAHFLFGHVVALTQVRYWPGLRLSHLSADVTLPAYALRSPRFDCSTP